MAEHCAKCGWSGKEEDLQLVVVEGSGEHLVCPECHDTGKPETAKQQDELLRTPRPKGAKRDGETR